MIDAIANPVPDARAQTSSGTRLKTKSLVADDGTRQGGYGGWFDSQRQEDCSLVIAADGMMRCLPLSSVASVGSYFGDSGCSMRLGLQAVPAACSAPVPPKYVIEFVTSQCVPFYRLYAAGSAFSGQLYQQSLGADGGINCQRSTVGLPGYALYSVGAEIAPSFFVAARIVTDP
jgi:hypothetical protein